MLCAADHLFFSPVASRPFLASLNPPLPGRAEGSPPDMEPKKSAPPVHWRLSHEIRLSAPKTPQSDDQFNGWSCPRDPNQPASVETGGRGGGEKFAVAEEGGDNSCSDSSTVTAHFVPPPQSPPPQFEQQLSSNSLVFQRKTQKKVAAHTKALHKILKKPLAKGNAPNAA